MNLVQPTLLAFEPDRPKLCLENLAALTIQFATQYINTPNMYFALFRAIAVKRLNVVDVISTFTELTFLVRQSDLNELFVLMNSLMRKQEIAKSQPAVQPRPLPKSS
jgi:hypothetical protein